MCKPRITEVSEGAKITIEFGKSVDDPLTLIVDSFYIETSGNADLRVDVIQSIINRLQEEIDYCNKSFVSFYQPITTSVPDVSHLDAAKFKGV